MDFHENWTPQTLQKVVRDHLRASQIIVVSNREPYVHNHDGSGRPVVQVPASGVVTALEPVMRACAGVWVAHGSGTADRDVVDKSDRIRVPPVDPSYTLRRVWLSHVQEVGYYNGFCNEGLWPLCLMAHVNPVFRANDWHTYKEVNANFADAVAAESNTDSPVVLIQDFHIALLPGLIRARIPKATIVLFWHIPWPNPETFAVCPWKRELLLHMLSADIIGFHTRNHCKNFLDTVDCFVGCRSDHEQMKITIEGHLCRVAPYPISIEWPPICQQKVADVSICRDAVRRRCDIGADVMVGLAIDRWDFTKGIIERLLTLETLLDKNPRYLGRISLLQIAVPSRGHLPAYRALQQQTHRELSRINAKFGRDKWRPIVLIDEYQEPQTVVELYRATDFCWVNSLHDGMNLVAKEFVAARDDGDGVLILSTFAGAAHELVEAVMINPFDVVESADSLETAMCMGEDERRRRMTLMRKTIRENNVYRWALGLLMDAARIRQSKYCVTSSG